MCRPGGHLKLGFKTFDGFADAFKKKWPVNTITFPVIYVNWLAGQEMVSRDTLTNVLVFLYKHYGAEAMWLPATDQVLGLFTSGTTTGLLKSFGLGSLVFLDDPLDNPMYWCFEKCDQRLSRVREEKYSSRDKLKAILPKGFKDYFLCVQITKGSEFGVKDTVPFTP